MPTHLFVITTIACWCISQPAPCMMNKWTVKGRASAHFKASNTLTWIGLETPEINFSSKIVNFKAPHNQIFSTIELNCLFLIMAKLLIVPWLICALMYPPIKKKHRASERTVLWWKWSSACDGHCFGPILRVWGVFAARNPESPVTHQQVSSTNLIGLSSFPKSLNSYKTFPELGLWQSLGKLASTLSHWLWGRLANVTIFVILMQLHSPLSLGLHYPLLPQHC